MQVNIKQAIRLFFSNPSLDMVFIEAIANSLDADASKISICISIDELGKQETLKITVQDNGVGFTQERYGKFCKLLQVEDSTHKGVGRLVYLYYFDTIEVSSVFNKQHRTFLYNTSFDEANSNMVLEPIDSQEQRTILNFSNCTLKRLSSYNSILPDSLKRMILEEFLPRFYVYKEEGKEIEIDIELKIGKVKKNQFIGNRKVTISLNDLPVLKVEEVNASQIRMFEDMVLQYSIEKKENYVAPFIITALCIDNRAYKLSDIISSDNIPWGYELIFLLKSSIFNGQVDPSRQTLTLRDELLKSVKKIFRTKIANIIQQDIPSFKESNEKTRLSLSKSYPHLLGYFEDEEIGIVSRSKSLEIAQQKFLRDQKTVLEAEYLDGEKYEKAMDLSSRSLAEYILYREKIISKLETITNKDSEATIHNLILPKRSILKNNQNVTAIYNNNLWLLDNKYMTYTTAMSERTMQEVVEEITQGVEHESDPNRPDLAIIFSDNPEDLSCKVDVVIIELKKRGIKLSKTEEVISQLKQRATKLMNYYPNRIQRIWFYGIVEFNDEFKLSLKNEHYTPLFSKDTLYYKENEWYLSLESDIPYKVGTYILSIDAFIKDAKAHNEIFLNILKEGFKVSKVD
ncbi:ATP-binding protein [Bacteroides difficilis]|jgi:anti-sigma regulatory factor (Ser/Thr protein kinase)|uniref:ATP-binding protein n=1 Tax=Bacteroides difficilis TaxID=2763021 RepID=A0ABR7CGP0_9BACE|nr:ATP-binding protein [Bacteroides difficilis]MBC5606948.1 ATP-binding protein [Bacteroides difficilis]